jgi:4-coumarate--CoA ligase
MAFVGILSFGGIFAGINPSHTPYELTHAFKVAEVKALIVEPELLPNALKAAAQANIPRSQIFVFDHHTSVTTSWNDSEVWGEGLGGEERWGGCTTGSVTGSDGMTRNEVKRRWLRDYLAVARLDYPKPWR